ncbi:carbohydrate kinase [Chitinimonas sp.]|uniref:carbohydrate kinase family protein n=1 Tax=Chitinimonas sp. TaxID=1934313 RepID=UPI002F92569B
MSTLPLFVAPGEALTDLIRTGPDSWVSKVGGATWNVARVMAGLGVPSAFAGAISQDCFGDDLWRASEAARLDMRFLQRVAKSPLLAVVHETQPPKYFFVGDDAADLHFDPSKLPEGWMQSVRWAHFCGISLARPPLAARLVELAGKLKAAGAKISYDPNFRVLMDERYDATLAAMTRLADVVKVSDEDLVGLFRSEDIEAAFATLRSWNPAATFLYTRGADGASLHQGMASWQCRPPRIEVVDTVGAGDASIGGLLFSLLNWPERQGGEHLRFSVACGAAACLAAGATPPELRCVEALYAVTTLEA